MQEPRRISNALISVFYKTGLDKVAKALHEAGAQIYSTGGTQEFIEKLGIKVNAVEKLTGYPSILDGRVKTLHPKVFGGILARRSNEKDQQEVKQYDIPFFDLVIVDLYPFEETLKKFGPGEGEAEIIEKIDIGGVSLIRAAAKNFNDTLIVCDHNDYENLLDELNKNGNQTTLDFRKKFAGKAFGVTAAYDSLISGYFLQMDAIAQSDSIHLRYGENPHQSAVFHGDLSEILEQLHGRELSYNNLLDVDAALRLIADFGETTVTVIKHNNPCGLASDKNLTEAWKKALSADPVSAFGGIIATNKKVDEETAREMDKIFLEILIAPDYDEAALKILQSKKNRILLKQKGPIPHNRLKRTILNGLVEQDPDTVILKAADLKPVTSKTCSDSEMADLLFADKIVKHAKSNTIVLAKNGQLLGIGCGQTSRVDALQQAIAKAKQFGFPLDGAVMSSDAFFPFPDCVEIAFNAGIKAVIQPGGSVKDEASIEYCNAHGMAMVFTGIRHFKH